MITIKVKESGETLSDYKTLNEAIREVTANTSGMSRLAGVKFMNKKGFEVLEDGVLLTPETLGERKPSTRAPKMAKSIVNWEECIKQASGEIIAERALNEAETRKLVNDYMGGLVDDVEFQAKSKRLRDEKIKLDNMRPSKDVLLDLIEADYRARYEQQTNEEEGA